MSFTVPEGGLGSEAEHEIAQLSSKLSQVSEKFINQWTGEGLLQYLGNKEAQLRQCIKNTEDQIQRAKKDIDELKQKASNNDLAVANQQAHAQQLEDDIRDAQAKMEQLLCQKEQWEKQLAEETKYCTEQKELLEAQEKATRQRLQALNQAEQYFRDRMGLEFRKIDSEHLQFVFSNVDSKAHDRTFYITIKIADKQYLVTDCCPPIDGLAEMVADLSGSNNLMKFVVEARKKFKLLT